VRWKRNKRFLDLLAHAVAWVSLPTALIFLELKQERVMNAISLKSGVTTSIATFSIALCAIFVPATAGFVSKSYAQSEASVAISLLPVASVVVAGAGASTAAGASVAAPVILSAVGAVFVVKLVEVTAKGTMFVIERASDGARVSVEIVGQGVKQTAISAGTAVTVSVIGTGIVLSALGEAIAFVPNELGKALLHNERITR
jgi:hypothetical protein